MRDHYLPSVVFLADQDVGLAAVKHVLENYPGHIRYVVTTEKNDISALCELYGCPTLEYAEITPDNAAERLGGSDMLILAWWPKIIPRHLIEIPRSGVVNFHPSLLPHNRGKNYNFWTIVEDTPFGVSLHFVNEDIDAGDILFQAHIDKTWEDNGGTLYIKAKAAMIELFKTHYEDLVEGRYIRIKQDISSGTFHYEKELDPASEIFLNKAYSGRQLLNLLRARTFHGKPSCYFHENGSRYEVQISIKEVKNGAD